MRLDADLVIFDNDGVLVDSEVIACRINLAVLGSIGHPIGFEEFCRRAIGTSRRDRDAMLADYWGRPLPEDYGERVRHAAIAAFRAELRPVAGMKDLVAALRLPRCVASSSTPDHIRLSLELTGLIEHLAPGLFSAVEVAHGKPAPDLFLHAAARMGVAPTRCIVVEDSVPGIRAAKAAGMAAIGFLAGSHRGPEHAGDLIEAGADHIAADAGALGRLLRIG